MEALVLRLTNYRIYFTGENAESGEEALPVLCFLLLSRKLQPLMNTDVLIRGSQLNRYC